MVEESNLERLEVLMVGEVLLEFLNVGADSVEQAYPGRVELKAIYQFRFDFLPVGVLGDREIVFVLLSLRDGDLSAVFSGMLRIVLAGEGTEDGEGLFAFGQFDLVVLPAHLLLQSVLGQKEPEVGVGLLDRSQHGKHLILIVRLCSDVVGLKQGHL